MRAAAVVAVRNAEVHIARCISDLVADGLDVVLIDNDSTDGTATLAKRYLGHGLVAIERVPWTGTFSITTLLEAKKALVAKLPHDWVLHVDDDEWLRPPWPGFQLIDALARVEAAGFNCINFEEMTFVAWPEEDYVRSDYAKHMTTYYFFEPSKPRLMRAWRRSLGVDSVATGGHLLTHPKLNLFPENFVLRHYLGLSPEYVFRKYQQRTFDPAELARGWHIQRIGITRDMCNLRPSPHVKVLSNWSSDVFDRSSPARVHYWRWPNSDATQRAVTA